MITEVHTCTLHGLAAACLGNKDLTSPTTPIFSYNIYIPPSAQITTQVHVFVYKLTLDKIHGP